MNSHSEDEDVQGDVFLDEDDILEEIHVDEEDLPDVDDGVGSDVDLDEPDDSMHIFTGHTGELYTVACSPTDTTLVATGGGDDKGFLWKIGQGDWAQDLQVPLDRTARVFEIARFRYPWGATSSTDQKLIIWDIHHSTPRCSCDHKEGVACLTWLGKTRFVATGSVDGK